MQVVEGITRQPLGYGLLSVLTPRSTADEHWQNEGVQWEALTCAPASGIGQPDCEPDEQGRTTAVGLPKFTDPESGMGEATPFSVYGSHSCTPVGHTVQYVQDRATEHLMAREEARAERALWTGDLGNNNFTEDAVVVTNPQDGSIKHALMALENWLGQVYGSRGVIHMPRALALLGLEDGALEIKGSTLQTELGTPVVAGAGYPASENGATWAYATPALLGYRSEVFPAASPAAAGFSRATNDMSAVSERTYLVGWDPCGTAGVEVGDFSLVDYYTASDGPAQDI
jgi:hypothetical protein